MFYETIQSWFNLFWLSVTSFQQLLSLIMKVSSPSPVP